MMRSVIMPHHGWSPQRLFAMLKDCQARERESWRSSLLSYSVSHQVEVGPSDRDYAVTWMSHLNSRFNFYPETFFLAVHNLDRFLVAVKSRPKYLKCIAATCLYVASKLVEEEEHIPGTGELVEVSRSGCRPRDILRMERIVLTKLSWDFHTPTALTYMEIFYSLIFSSSLKRALSDPDNASLQLLVEHLNHLTAELQHAICNYSLTPFPSAALALALLSLRMENLLSDPKCWATVTSQIQALAKVKTSDLMRCREVLQSILPCPQNKSCTNPSNAVYLVSASVSNVPQEVQKTDRFITLHQAGPTKRKAQDFAASSPTLEHIKKFHHHRETDMANYTIGYREQTASYTEPKSQGKLAHNEFEYSTVKMKILDSESHEMLVDHADCPPLTKPVYPYVSDLLVETRNSETSDLETSITSYDVNESGDYDSDKTLSASEGEEDDYMGNKKHEATRMRPLTYAEIVKFGLIGTAAAVASMSY